VQRCSPKYQETLVSVSFCVTLCVHLMFVCLRLILCSVVLSLCCSSVFVSFRVSVNLGYFALIFPNHIVHSLLLLHNLKALLTMTVTPETQIIKEKLPIYPQSLYIYNKISIYI
jgi:hypothetical protein